MRERAPDFTQMVALVEIAYRLGYFDWADRLRVEIQRLREVFEEVKEAN